MRRILILTPLILSLAACVAPPPPAPPPPPPPAPRPTPTPPPPPAVAWQDGPATPGTWRWTREARGSVATFGIAGQDPSFTARCDADRRTITLNAAATPGTALTIQTSEGARSFPTTAIGTPPRAGVALSASDGFLDRIAFSRGRFRVQFAGAAPLIIPAWAEFARTVEDCRG
ncbi:hypothetical protein ACFSGX_13260 [Sphingomonas arantia]|uniref:Lipoprotein n=1 Tax=Sphingomonas arantia TaxID=1460676 RepID=A0ABW4U1W6_9SPHN